MARMDTLLLIDAGLADLDILLSGLNPGVVPFVVQPDQDALEVLAAALETASTFDTLALVAHGKPGEVLIGREPITMASLSSRSGAWASLASHRIESLHLYACHAGQDQAFVDGLSAITGCAVAAADTTIGHAGLGAVWQLDVSSSPRFGSFQANAANGLVPFSRAAQASWLHQLATYYVGTPASGNGAGTLADPWNQTGFNAATITTSGNTLSIASGVTLTSTTSKLAGITVSGAGNLSLTGYSNQDISLINPGGTLAIATVAGASLTSANLPTLVDSLVLGGAATADAGIFVDTALAGQLGVKGGNIDVNGKTLTVQNWSGQQIQSLQDTPGTGTVNVTTANTFTGGTWRLGTINSLTVPAGASGALTGTLSGLAASGFVINGAVRALPAADAVTMAAYINGTGSLTLAAYTTEDLSGLINITTVNVTTATGAVLDSTKLAPVDAITIGAGTASGTAAAIDTLGDAKITVATGATLNISGYTTQTLGGMTNSGTINVTTANGAVLDATNLADASTITISTGTTASSTATAIDTIGPSRITVTGATLNISDTAANLAASSTAALTLGTSVAVTGTTAAAADLNTTNGKISVALNAASVTTLSGLLADVNTAYAANTANTISGLGDETVTITNSAGTLLASDLTTAGNATSGTVTVTNGQTVTGTVAEVTAALVTASSKVVIGSASTATVSNAATVAAGAAIANTSNVTASFSAGISDTLVNLASGGIRTTALNAVVADDSDVVITISDASGTQQAADLSAVGGGTTGTVTVSNAQTVTGTTAAVTAALVTDATEVVLAAASTVTVTDAATAAAGAAIATTNNVTVSFSAGISDTLVNLASGGSRTTALNAVVADDSDVVITISDASGTKQAADLSAVGAGTTGTVTVSNAQTVTGTTAEVTAALVTDATEVVLAAASTVTVTDAATAAAGAAIATTNNVTVSFSAGISDTLVNLASGGSRTTALNAVVADDSDVVITISDASGTKQAADLSAVGGGTTGTVTVSNAQAVTGTTAAVTAALVTDATEVVLAAASTVTVTDAATAAAGAAIATTNNVTASFSAGISDTLANLASSGIRTTALNAVVADDSDVVITISDASGTQQAADLSAVGGGTTGTVTVSNAQTVTGTADEVIAAVVTAPTKVNLNTASTLNASTYTTQDFSGVDAAFTLNVTTIDGAVLESTKLLTADTITIGAGSATINAASTDETALAAKTTVNNSTTLTINNYVSTDLSGLSNQGSGSIVVNTTTSAVLDEAKLADATSVVLGAAATGAASAIDGIGTNGSKINLNSQILSVSDYTNQDLSGITSAGTLNVSTATGAVLESAKLATADAITIGAGTASGTATDVNTLGEEKITIATGTSLNVSAYTNQELAGFIKQGTGALNVTTATGAVLDSTNLADATTITIGAGTATIDASSTDEAALAAKTTVNNSTTLTINNYVNTDLSGLSNQGSGSIVVNTTTSAVLDEAKLADATSVVLGAAATAAASAIDGIGTNGGKINLNNQTLSVSGYISENLSGITTSGTLIVTTDTGAVLDAAKLSTADSVTLVGTNTATAADADTLGSRLGGTATLNITTEPITADTNLSDLGSSLILQFGGNNTTVVDGATLTVRQNQVSGYTISGTGTVAATGTASADTFDASGITATTNFTSLAGADSVTIAPSALGSVDVVNGGEDTDTLIFSAAATVADVDFTNVSSVEILQLANGTNSVSLGSEAEQAGITTVTGSTGADTLNLLYGTTGLTFTAGTGTDTLSYSADSTAQAITLSNILSNSASGSVVNNGTDSFTGLEAIVGGSGTSDSITSTSADEALIVTGTNAGTIDGFAFSGVESVNLGNGNDSATVQTAGSLSGTLNLDGWNDTLSYAGYGSAVSATLSGANTLSAITAITGGVTGVEFLSLSSNNDTLTVGGSGSISGNVDFGAGSGDTLSYAGNNNVITVSLNSATSTAGATGINGTTSGFETLIGGSGSSDTLNAKSGVNNLSVAADGTTTLDTNLTVSGFETINLGAGSDASADTATFSRAFSGTVDLGDGNDTATINDGGSVTSLAGGAGTDTLNLDGAANSITVTGTGAGTTAGTTGGTTTFSGFETVNGLGGTDAFTVNSASSSTITVDGGTGTDSLSVASSDTGANSLTLSSAGGGSLGNVTFAGIESIALGSGGDTATVATGSLSGNLNLGDGSNSLTISGGSSLIGSYTGGTGNDSVTLSGGDVTGAIDLGAGTNSLLISSTGSTVGGAVSFGNGTSDTLSYAGYGSAVSVTLSGISSNAGTTTSGGATAITSGIVSGFESLTGSSNNSDYLLVSTASNTLILSGANQGTVDGFSFSSFETVDLNAGNDTVQFTSGDSLSGLLNGNAGSNTLDYSDYGSAVTVSQATNTATGTGGISGFQTVLGSSAADTFTAHDHYLTNLQGNAGDDTFNISVAGLDSTDTIVGGADADTLVFTSAGTITDSQFTNVTTVETVTLTGASTLSAGTEASQAGIATINTGTGATTVNSTLAGYDLTVNAANLADNASLTLSGSASTNDFTVSNLTGSVLAGDTSGTLSVTTLDASDNAIGVTTGSGATTITATGSGDTVTTDATKLGQNTLLSFFGAAKQIVTNLVGNLTGASLTGTLNVSTADAGDEAISITTGTAATTIAGSSASDTISTDAALLAQDTTLTLSGSSKEVVTNLVGDISATGLTGTLTVTAGDNTNDNGISITTGTANTTITASGTSDTLTVNADAMADNTTLDLNGSATYTVSNLEADTNAADTTGTVSLAYTDVNGNAATITTGSGATTVSGTTSGDTLTINATALVNDTTLTESGAAQQVVTGLVGNISATNLTGTLSVTTADNTTDNGISIVTGSGATTIAGTAATDTISTNAAALANNTTLTLSGSSSEVVTNLIGDISASALTGGLTVTAADNTIDNGISITTGSANTTITASGTSDTVTVNADAMVDNTTLDINGSATFTVSNLEANTDAAGTSGTVSLAYGDVTGSDNAATISTGSGAITVSGTSSGDTLTINAASLANDTTLTESGAAKQVVTGLVGDINASALTGTLTVTTGDNSSDNDISITTGTANTTIDASGIGDTITVNADAMADNTTLDLNGSATYTVSNLEADTNAADTTGTVSLAYTDVNGNAATITTGSGATTVSGTTSGDTLTINATALANDTTLTQSGAAQQVVTGLVGNISATNLTGTLAVTTADNTTDNGISIVTGSAATTIAGTAATDTISTNAAALANNTILTLSGSSNEVVTNLVGDISATALTGTLTVTAGDNTNDNGISITAGTANTTITASGTSDTLTVNADAMADNTTLDLNGSATFTVSNLEANTDAAGTSGTVSLAYGDVTGSDNAATITTGSGATTVSGTNSGDTLTISATSLANNTTLTESGAAKQVVTGLVGDINATGLTGTLTVTTGDNTNDNSISIVTGSAATTITGSAATDTISTNAAALADNTTLTLAGSANEVVTNLVGDISATALTGTLTVTTGTPSDQSLNITTGSANTTITGNSAGNALSLDGVNDYATIPKSITDDFTIEYWIKTSQTSPTGSQWYSGSGIVDAEVGGGTTDFGTSLLNNKVAFGVGQSDTTIQSQTSINTGSWTHVAATRNNSTGLMQLYINGTLEASGTGPTGSRTAPSAIAIGSLLDGGANFNGSIDELRLWNNVRSQNDIQTSMNTGLTPQSGLVAYYTFDQGSPAGNNSGLSSLSDLSGNNNTGTLYNLALSGASSNWVAGTVGAPGAAVVNADQMADSTTLDLNGATTFTVTNLEANTDAAGSSGTVSLAYTDVTDNAATISTGSGATTVSGTASGDTLTIDATSLANNTTLTESGAAKQVVTGLVGDISATNLTGTLSVTTADNTTDNAISITTGSGATTIAGTAATDTISTNAAALAQNTVLTLSGSSSEVVTNLVGDVSATALTGTLTLTTGDAADNGISITTGTANTTITASGTSDTITVNADAMADNSTFDINGSATYTVSNLEANTDAAGTSGTVSLAYTDVTDNAATISTGSGATTLSGTTSGDTLTINAASLAQNTTLTESGVAQQVVNNLVGDISATALTGTLTVATGDATDNGISITTGTANTTITGSGSGDTITVNADAMADSTTFDINGSATYTVSNLEANTDAAGSSGSLSLTYSNVTDNAATLLTGSGNVVVNGGDASDTVTVTGLSTNNQTFNAQDSTSKFNITAGANSQTITGSKTGSDTIAGGGGTDTLSYAGGSNVNVTISSYSTQAGGSTGQGTDSFSGIESLVGATGNDTLRGTTADTNEVVTITSANTGTIRDSASSGTFAFSSFEQLDLQGGNDTLTVIGNTSGVSLSTSVDLGSGNNSLTMTSSAGSIASVTSGTGDDTILIRAGSVTGAVTAGDGSNTLTISGTNSSVGSYTGGSDTDSLTLSGGDVVGNVSTSTGDDILLINSTSATVGGNLDLGGGTGDTLSYGGPNAAIGATFDGSTSYAAYINEPETSVSREIVFSTTSGGGLFSVDNEGSGSSGGSDRILAITSDGNVYSRVWSNEVLQSTGLNLTDGNTHRLVFTLGSGGTNIYVDGIRVLHGNLTASAFNWDVYQKIGSAPDSGVSTFNGTIDSYRTWNTELTADQAKGLAALPTPVHAFEFNNNTTDTGSSPVALSLAAGTNSYSVLPGSGYTNAVSVTLNDITNNTGSTAAGGATAITGAATGFENLVGGANSGDTITDATGDSTLAITGANSGTLDGMAFSTFENLNLSGGNDTATVSGNDSGLSLYGSLDLGDGTNSLTMSGSAGSIASVSSGTGDDIYSISAGSVIGAVSAGDGLNTLTISNTSSSIGSYVGGTGVDSITLSGGDVKGDVSTSTGNDTVLISSTLSTIDGNLNLGTGDSDTLSYAGYSNAVSVTLTDITSNAGSTGIGGATAISGTAAGFENLIGGSTSGDTVTDSTGDSTIVISGANSGTIDGMTFSAIENLSLSTGTDGVTVQTGGSLSGNLNLGDGTTNTLVMNSGAGAIGSVTSTSGNDTFTLDGGSVTGALAAGDGTNILTINNTASTIGSYTGGSGIDTIDSKGGDVIGAVSTGAAADSVTLTLGATTGAVTLGANSDSADGNDSLSLTASSITGAVNTGSAADMVTLASTSTITGDVTLGIDNESTSAASNGDKLTLNASTVTGNVTMGSGADKVELTNGTINGTSKTLSLGSDNNSNDGNDTLTGSGASITATIITGSGADTVSLSATSVVTGNITLGIDGDTSTASNADTLTLDASSISGNLSTGSGADAVSVLNTSTISGTVTLGSNTDSADGADTLTVTGTSSSSKSVITGNITTGAGADTLTLTDATIGVAGQTISLGSDNNGLDGNDKLTASGTAITANITTGSGSDELTLSSGSSINGNVSLGIDGDNPTITDSFDSLNGWTGGALESSSSYYGSFLGRYSNGSKTNGQDVYKSFTLNSQATAISFDFIKFDTWDNEDFTAYIDNTPAFTGNYLYNRAITSSSGTTGGYSWTITPKDTLADHGFNSYGDQTATVTITLPTGLSNFKLGFGSNLGESPDNESYGIDNLSISQTTSVSSNDTLTLNASTITGDVTAGSGADAVSVLTGSKITGSVNLGANGDTKDSGDTLTVTGVVSGTKSEITGSITTGGGADEVIFTDATIGAASQTLSLGSDNNSNDSNDKLTATRTAITATITTGSGSDTLTFSAASSVLGDVTLGTAGDTSNGNTDTLTLNASRITGNVTTGSGADAVNVLTTSTITGNVTLGTSDDAQDGADTLTVTGTSSSSKSVITGNITTGAGGDTLTLTDATIGIAGQTIALGTDSSSLDGNDRLIASGSAITANITTGSGSDTFSLSAGSSVIGDVSLGSVGDNQAITDSANTLNNSFDTASGWTGGTVDSTNSYYGSFLGRYAAGTQTNGQDVYKSFSLSTSPSTISFDFIRLDSWDGESFKAFINNTEAFSSSFTSGGISSASGTSNGFSWTIAPKDSLAGYGFGGWNDHTAKITITLPAGYSNFNKLGFGSTLNQDISDESYGIDNLTIGSHDDSLILDSSSITGNVITGSGADAVTLSNTSTITGTVNLGSNSDAYDGNDSLTLTTGSNIVENVDLGAANDTLTFAAGISSPTTITGNVAFGDGTGDKISYSGNIGPITVALDSISADAVGTATGAKASYITGNVTGFEAIVGSNYNSPTSDSVTGDTIYDNTVSSLVVLTSSNTGTIDNLDFSSIENLQLRSGADTLSFQGTSGAPGSIAGLADGGGIEGATYANGVYSGGTKTDTGIDLLDYSSYQVSSGVSVDLSQNKATGVFGGLAGGLISGDGSIATTTTDSSFENVDGSRFNDTIIGDVQTTQANVLRGFDGADSIQGLAGNDTIDGGNGIGSNSTDGADTIQGGLGADTIIASFGNDSISGGTFGTASDASIDTLTYAATAISSARIEGLDISLVGTDTGTVLGDANASLSVSTFTNTYNSSISQQLITAPTNQVSKDWTQSYTDIQNLVLSEQSDILRIDPTDVSTGSIDARGGSFDSLDYSTFDAASSVLVNLSGAAYSFDFDNNGKIDTTIGEITITNANSATNVIVTAASSQGGANGVSGFEVVIGGAADDAIVGNTAANLLVGNAGDDRIDGGAGNDTIYGGTGDDYIKPGDGADYVFAGAGINTIAITSSDLAQDSFNVDPNGINIFSLQGNGTSGNSSSIDAPTGSWDPGNKGIDLLDGGDPVVNSSGVTVYDTINGTSTADIYQFGGVAFKNIGNVDLGAGNDSVGTAATTKGIKVNYNGGADTDSITLNLTFGQFAKLNASGLYVADVQNYLDSASGKTFSSSQADFTANNFEAGGVAVITPGVYNALQGDPAATTFNSAYGVRSSTISSGDDVNLSASALTTSTATALSVPDIVSAFVQASGVKGSDAITLTSGGGTTGSTTASQDASAISRTVDDRADSVLSAYGLGTDRSSFTAGDDITLTLSGNVKADTTAESLGFVVKAGGTAEAAGSRDSSLSAGDALSLSISGTAAQTVAASNVAGLAIAGLANRTYGIDDANLTDTTTDSVQAGSDLSLQATASSSNRVSAQTVGTESLGSFTLVNNGTAATDRFTTTQIGADFPLINGDRVRFTTSNGSVQADRDYYVANVIPVTGEFQLSSEPNGDPIDVVAAGSLQAYRPAVATADAISTVTGVDLNRTTSGVQAGDSLSLRASAADVIAASATSVAGDATAGVFRLGGMDGLNLASEVSSIQALVDTVSLAGSGASLNLNATDAATLKAASTEGAALTEANIQVFGSKSSASTAGDDLSLSTQADLSLSGSASSTAGSAEARSGAGAGAGVTTAGVTNLVPSSSSYSVVTGLADGTQTAGADLAVQAKGATTLNASASTVSGADTLASLWTSATGNILATFDLNLNTTTTTPSFVGPQYLAAGQLVQLDTASATATGLAVNTDYAVKLLGFGAVDATADTLTMPTGITYAVNDAVRFRLNSTTAPNSSDSRYGLALGTTYYVKSVTGTTFTLSASPGGPVIDLAADSLGPADQLVDADRFQLLTLPTAPGGSYAVAPVTASASGVSLSLPSVANAFAGSREVDRTLNNSDSLNLAQVSGISGNGALRGLIAGAQSAITAVASGVLNAVARNTANDATASAGLVAEGLSDTAITAGSAGIVKAEATIAAVADAATTGNNALVDNSLTDLTITARGLTASNTANDITIGGVGDVQATASLAGRSTASTVLGDSDALAALKATGLEALSNGFTATIGQQGDFSASAVIGTVAAPLLVEAISASSGDATVQAASTAIGILGSYTAPGFSSLQAGAAQGDISASATVDLKLRASANDGIASVTLSGVGGAGTSDVFGIKDMALTAGADLSQVDATAIGRANLLAQSVDLAASSAGSTSARGLFSTAVAPLPVSFGEDGRIGAIAQQSTFSQSVSVSGTASSSLSNDSLGIGNASITVGAAGTLDARAISQLDSRAQSVTGAASA